MIKTQKNNLAVSGKAEVEVLQRRREAHANELLQKLVNFLSSEPGSKAHHFLVLLFCWFSSRARARLVACQHAIAAVLNFCSWRRRQCRLWQTLRDVARGGTWAGMRVRSEI
jgi:hypothetical protein